MSDLFFHNCFHMINGFIIANHKTLFDNTNNDSNMFKEDYHGYPDNCPPNTGEDIFGIFIRLVPHNNRVRRKDFKSSYEKNKLHFPDLHDECSQRAISLYKEKHDALDFIDNHPKAYTKCLVYINIPRDSGVIIQCNEENRKSHHNWWIPNRIDPTMIPIVKFEGPFLEA